MKPITSLAQLDARLSAYPDDPQALRIAEEIREMTVTRRIPKEVAAAQYFKARTVSPTATDSSASRPNQSIGMRKPMRLIPDYPMTRYLVKVGDVLRGPCTYEGVETLAMNGTLTREGLIALEGTQDFRPVSEWAFYGSLFPRNPWTVQPEQVVVRSAKPIESAHELAARLEANPLDIRAYAVEKEIKQLAETQEIDLTAAKIAYFEGKRGKTTAQKLAHLRGVIFRDVKSFCVFLGVMVLMPFVIKLMTVVAYLLIGLVMQML